MSRKKKSFARYFKKTFKQNKFLLFKYLLSSILYIIISVLSNLLAVKELTYLNAFLVIGYFSTMIAFGVSTGISIMVSQSISSHAKVEKYIKIGFEITLLISIIATTLLALFPSFFMETIGGYMPDDYTFYYIMCAYFFLTCLFEYMASMIKEFKLMKINMLAYILPLIITVLGFFILYFAGIYYLNLIAIIYVISALFGVIYSYFALLKNKKIKINILKFNFSKLTSKQWIIIINNFAIQIIWEVGYYATSVFLLRMSDSVFNTYSYLENVLYTSIPPERTDEYVGVLPPDYAASDVRKFIVGNEETDFIKLFNIDENPIYNAIEGRTLEDLYKKGVFSESDIYSYEDFPDVEYSDILNDKIPITTSDKFWLISAYELYRTSGVENFRDENGHLDYTVPISMTAFFGNDETYWLRGVYDDRGDQALNVDYDCIVGNSPTLSNTYAARPCFKISF